MNSTSTNEKLCIFNIDWDTDDCDLTDDELQELRDFYMVIDIPEVSESELAPYIDDANGDEDAGYLDWLEDYTVQCLNRTYFGNNCRYYGFSWEFVNSDDDVKKLLEQ